MLDRDAGYDPERDVRLDATNLRGIAHPIRVRILTSLRVSGPATATLLAERLGESTGTTSYHLRQLAAYGFVVEDPDRGTGRERWWRPAHRTTYGDFPADHADPETAALGEEYLRSLAEVHIRRLAEYPRRQFALPQEWRDAGQLNHATLRLGPDEAARLGRELLEVVLRYRRDQGDPEPADAEPVAVQFMIQPWLASDA